MSSQAECPLCGHVSKNNVEPTPDWGLAFKGTEAQEQIYMVDRDMKSTATPRDVCYRVGGAMHKFGLETYWCPCGRMMWMQEFGWMVSLDYISRLAVAIRDMEPADFAKLFISLAVLMPQEIHRLRRVLVPTN